MALPKSYHSNVFINCAFDSDFRPFFRAIVFTIHDCGYIARCAMEVDDGVQNRIDKIFKIMADCRFGIHDLSRTELDDEHKLPRFNMPLELGMFLGVSAYGLSERRPKICLILDKERHRYQKFISDIAGKDIKSHDGKPEKTIAGVRDWLDNNTKKSVILPGPKHIGDHFKEFSEVLPKMCDAFGIDPDQIQFKNYVKFVEEWLKLNAPTIR